MKNLELKSNCSDADKIRRLVHKLGAEYHKTMHQLDTYFTVPRGRLKLREIDGEVAQLIHYERENQHNSRYSDYEIVDIADSAEFKNIMAVALGVRAIVDKVRELWMYGNTRIHIDNVTELGHFVELETVITNQTDTEARAEHNFVKQMLEIDDLELVSESYGDFMFSVK